MANASVLVLSDIHAPYNHPDFVAFLKKIKQHYKPDRIIGIGDEIDGQSWSFHDPSPDLPSPSDELALAIQRLQPIYKLFPKVDLVESNHGSLVYRKQKVMGLPRSVFRSYREIIEAPKDWRWHFDLTIKLSDGKSCYFHHGKSARAGGLSQTMSMNAVQGHFHEKFYIHYWANPTGLYWQMQVGCLADDKSLAMAYNNNNLKRPIVGVGIILNGQPKLLPMVLNSNGRWIGKLR